MLSEKEQFATPASPAESRFTYDFSDIIGIVWKRLWLIALVVIVLTGLAVGITLQLSPIYDASIKLLVGQEQGLSDSPQNIGGLQQVTQTMAEGVITRPVAEEVIRELGLNETPEDLLENLSSTQIRATQFVEVTYADTNPQRAQQVANTTGEVFSRQIAEVSPNADTITVAVWEEAALPEDPVSPNVLVNIGLALAFGLLLGVGLALLLEFLDDTWRSPEEAEQITGVPTFGVIPGFKSR